MTGSYALKIRGNITTNHINRSYAVGHFLEVWENFFLTHIFKAIHIPVRNGLTTATA